MLRQLSKAFATENYPLQFSHAFIVHDSSIVADRSSNLLSKLFYNRGEVSLDEIRLEDMEANIKRVAEFITLFANANTILLSESREGLCKFIAKAKSMTRNLEIYKKEHGISSSRLNKFQALRDYIFALDDFKQMFYGRDPRERQFQNPHIPTLEKESQEYQEILTTSIGKLEEMRTKGFLTKNNSALITKANTFTVANLLHSQGYPNLIIVRDRQLMELAQRFKPEAKQKRLTNDDAGPVEIYVPGTPYSVKFLNTYYLN